MSYSVGFINLGPITKLLPKTYLTYFTKNAENYKYFIRATSLPGLVVK